MQRLLKEIASIQPGYSFRERIEPAVDGNLRVIQIKDIGPRRTVVEDELIRVDSSDIKPNFFVQPGDVLITTRGTSRRAAAVSSNMPNTIFVAQIFAIRNLEDGVLPEYLAWYLHQLQAQDYFDTYTSGAYIQNIRKEVLANLPVDIPSIETQRLILKIAELRQRESDLKQIIELRRNILINEALERATRR